MFQTLKAHRAKAMALTDAEAQAIVHPTTTTAGSISTAISQARIFATEHAKNAGRDMLDTIVNIKTRAGQITRIALGVSMPHQIGFILALAIPQMRFTSVSGVLEAITMIGLALGTPIATDLLILNCIETIGAAAAADKFKRRAFKLMIVPVLASGTVNFLAPAPLLLKVLAAFVVTMVPMAVSLRFIRPDFRKMQAMEFEITNEVGPVEDDGLVPNVHAEKIRATKARVAALSETQRAYYDKLPTAYKRRRYLDRVDAKKLIDAVENAMGEAPVSPAPAGR